MAIWRAEEKTIKESSGYTRSERKQRRASTRFDQLRNVLLETTPTTMEGLRAKARAARVSGDDDLQQQVTYDIGTMFDELEPSGL